MAREQLRRELWIEDGERCHYCRATLALADATFDHIVPQGFGGTWHRWNLVIACKPCNGQLRDAIRKCECRRCNRAVNRFHQVIKPQIGTAGTVIRDVVIEIPANVERAVRALQERLARHEMYIDAELDHDSPRCAALRGKCGAYREAIALLLADVGKIHETLKVDPVAEIDRLEQTRMTADT